MRVEYPPPMAWVPGTIIRPDECLALESKHVPAGKVYWLDMKHMWVEVPPVWTPPSWEEMDGSMFAVFEDCRVGNPLFLVPPGGKERRPYMIRETIAFRFLGVRIRSRDRIVLEDLDMGSLGERVVIRRKDFEKWDPMRR